MRSCESRYNPSNRNEHILKRYFNCLIIKTMDPRNLMLGEEKPGPARVEALLSRREIYSLMETKGSGSQDPPGLGQLSSFFHLRTPKMNLSGPPDHFSAMGLQ